jgi:hypothetical protein
MASRKRVRLVLTLTTLASLLLVANSASYGAMAKTKPNYHLKVTISGIPKKIVLYKHYAYTIKIKNTGRLKLNRVIFHYKDGTYVVPPYPSGCKHVPGPSPHDESTVNCRLSTVKAGTTRRITLPVVYNDPSVATDGNGSRAYVVADGYIAPKRKPVAEAHVIKYAWY